MAGIDEVHNTTPSLLWHKREVKINSAMHERRPWSADCLILPGDAPIRTSSQSIPYLSELSMFQVNTAPDATVSERFLYAGKPTLSPDPQQNLVHTPHSCQSSKPRDFLPLVPSVITFAHFPRTPDAPMRLPDTPCGFNSGPPLTGSDLSEELTTFSEFTTPPDFLYLGPELSLPTHVAELKMLGTHHILNIAAECNSDDYSLGL
ncbi:hypothetical protein V8B97DRAFT_2005976 [Scleroderma yunnanense]